MKVPSNPDTALEIKSWEKAVCVNDVGQQLVEWTLL